MTAGDNVNIVGQEPTGMPYSETGTDLYEPTYGTKVLTVASDLIILKTVPFWVAGYKKKKFTDYYDPEHQ